MNTLPSFVVTTHGPLYKAARAAAAAARSPQIRGRACPACNGSTERVARRFLDRLLSILIPVKRYRCTSATCAWEGVLKPRSGRLAR